MCEFFYVVGVLARVVWAVLVVALLVVLVMAMLAGAAGVLPAAGGANDGVVLVLRGCGELVESVRNSLPPVCE